MKRVLTWDDPEIRGAGDLNGDYVKFILNFLKNVVKIKPFFVSFHQKIKVIENNGIYIGCPIFNVPKFRNGYTRKLSGSWQELCVHNINDIEIHPGTFSFIIQKGDFTPIVFSIYKNNNSIALADFFDILLKLKSDNHKKEYEKLEKLLKIMFDASKKSFKNYEASKISVIEILKELKQIKIGTDPEFSVVPKNKKDTFVNAVNILKVQEGKIGTDGHASILELRPDPSNDIDEFLSSIDKIVEETSEMIDDNEYDLLTGGGAFRGEPLGGHIHFSNLLPTQDFISLLDTYIGLPLKNCSGGKRAEGGNAYDQASMYRNKKYTEDEQRDDGNINGFEYRTPPNFWVNEKLTKATYIIAMLLAKTYMLHKKQQKQFEYDTTLCFENYKKLVDYEKYAPYIDYFYDFVSSKSKINGYVFSNWEITKKKEKNTIRIPILATEDSLIKELVPQHIDIYRPPFRSIMFYGLSEKSTSLCAINIDSYYINANVHTGYLHRWMKDIIRNICIIDKNLKESNINDFVQNGRLWIGLSMSLRQALSKIELEVRNNFFKTFLKRLSVFIRESINKPLMLDANDRNEVIEYEKIKSLISFK